MADLKVFNNDEFGEVRVVEIDGEPWIVGKDIAGILGYSNTRKALLDHVDEDDKKRDGVTIRDSIGREQNPTIINESGLYSLVLSSKLPKAKEFKRWVTKDVLPTIRKTGSYTKQMTPLEITAANAAALVEHEKRMNILEERLDTAVDQIHINDAQAFHLSNIVKTRVLYFVKYESRNYRSMISQLWKHVNDTCGVAKYRNIRSVDFDQAMSAARCWEPKY